MVATAQALAANIKNKTIVLTGAMVPYKFGSSDGLFNLGSGSHSLRRCRRECTW
jgi:L-asparaginase